MGVDLVRIQVSLACANAWPTWGWTLPCPPATRTRHPVALGAHPNHRRPGHGPALVRPDRRPDLTCGAGHPHRRPRRGAHHPSPHYDTLLAKVIVSHHSGRFADALQRSRRALDECHIGGLATNIGLLRQIAAHPDMATPCTSTPAGWKSGCPSGWPLTMRQRPSAPLLATPTRPCRATPTPCARPWRPR